MAKLFCFGLGYSARELIRRARARGWRAAGTVRTEDKAARLRAGGVDARAWTGEAPLGGLEKMLNDVDHLLISIPPGESGDPVLSRHRNEIIAMRRLTWLGYLSTTGVYGDTDGAEVDETSPPNPSSPRGQYRVNAEDAWLELFRERGLPVHVFRLAGIYGPGRSPLDQVREGAARRIDKPGHKFSRIHRDDVAGVLEASMARPNKGGVYNVCDDLPAPQSAVITHAYQLVGKTPPPFIPFDEAAKTMSPMGLSFWRDNRVVSNRRIRDELGVKLAYPTFREGLAGILREQMSGGLDA